MIDGVTGWNLAVFQNWLIVVMRVAPVIFMMPVFHSRNIPVRVKAGMTLLISLALLPTVHYEMKAFPSEPLGFIFFAAGEIMIGFLLGLTIRLVFAGVQLAGEIVGFQMGFGMARVMDPNSSSESTVITEFYYIVALLLFLAIDGHHWFFRSLAESFRHLRPGEFPLNPGLVELFLTLSGRVFTLAVKIAAPILAVLLLIKVALGISARMAPQVNLLMTSFPLTIGCGLVFISLSLDIFWATLKGTLEDSGRGMINTVLPLMKR